MLHVVTEIGKPGREEREKRHFPWKSNHPTEERNEARARRYISHGYGDDFHFTPHNAHQDPEYTDCGPDWSSSLRYIPSPHNPKHITEIWPDEWKSLRAYPWKSRRTATEWSFHPDGLDAVKKCSFQGIHRATQTSSTEISHSMMFGKGRLAYAALILPVVNKRNGIGVASLGDKSYQVVEYAPGFHKVGSTRPAVTFGGNTKIRPDTFVPLQELPPIPRESYRNREKSRQKNQEVLDVESIECWRPATPLQPVGSQHPLPVAPTGTTGGD